MKTKNINTEFGPETRFEVNPVPPVPFRAVLENEFERMNKRLLRQRLAEVEVPALGGELRRAANEAAGLAWATNFPLLFFPALFEERVQLALQRVMRQATIMAETRELIAA